MPQLDITINLIWCLFSILGIGVLYLQNIYIYLPFFIRYWKFRSFYPLYLMLNVLYSSSKFQVSNCTLVPYGLSALYVEFIYAPYSLEVDEYCDYSTHILKI